MKHLRQFCMGLFLVLALSIPALAGDLPYGVTGEIPNNVTGNMPCRITGDLPNGVTGDMPQGITGQMPRLLPCSRFVFAS